jgi:hypothetical protein
MNICVYTYIYVYIYIYQVLTDEELAWMVKEHDKNEAEIKHYHHYHHELLYMYIYTNIYTKGFD